MSLFTDIENALNSKELKEGWCTYRKAEVLASCIVSTAPELIVEVGVWAGRSLIPMAMSCKYVGKGKVIGIDPWSKEAACEGLEGANLNWWTNVAPYEWIYGEFRKALIHFGVEDIVQIYRCRSDEFEPPNGIDILHLDGSHTTQALRDVQRYCPCVREGGFLFMDDISWVSSNSSNIITTVIELGFEETRRFCTPEDTGGLFQRLSCPKS